MSRPVADDATRIALRPMTVADIRRVLPHEDELFAGEAWSADSYRDELADRRYRHYVIAERVAAERVGEREAPAGDRSAAAPVLLGWAGVLVIAETAQILTVGVVPDEQRRGIGQALLDALLDEARRRHATEAVLEVRVDNEPARRLYERNGFAPLRVRRGYYDLGRVDALEMKREL